MYHNSPKRTKITCPLDGEADAILKNSELTDALFERTEEEISEVHLLLAMLHEAADSRLLPLLKDIRPQLLKIKRNISDVALSPEPE